MPSHPRRYLVLAGVVIVGCLAGASCATNETAGRVVNVRERIASALGYLTPTDEPAPQWQPTPTARPVPIEAPTASPTPPLAQRLASEHMLPRSSKPWAASDAPVAIDAVTAEPSQVGALDTFWLHDLDEGKVRQVSARLQHQSRHLQMWVECGVEVDDAALAASAKVFDEVIYPTTRRVFGRELSPGIDGEARLAVLNAKVGGAAGYFASANGYPRTLNPYSNEREMFVMNVGALTPGTDAYASVLAHEFQHMIHWSADSRESAWVNEGMSELAEDLNGYGWSMGNVGDFYRDADVQLNDWPADSRLGAHYGASFLLMRYLYERHGADVIHALVQSRATDVDGLDAVLAAKNDSFEAVFGDWVLTNALGLTDYYGRESMDLQATPQVRLDTLPVQYAGIVHQFGTEYLELDVELLSEGIEVAFRGSPLVPVVPNRAASGTYQWWSNRGDLGYSVLWREIDVAAAVTATLRYSIWHDLEEHWDYGYLRASVDGGETWSHVATPSMTADNPYGVALGPGYTGASGSRDEPTWVAESINLNPYVGHRVVVAFECVTDDAVNLPGLCLDNFQLEVDGRTVWQDDVESGEGDWASTGFLRLDNRLPQRFLVQFACVHDGEVTSRRLSVGDSGQANWVLGCPGEGSCERAVLAVSGVTRYTTECAHYLMTMAKPR